MKRVSMFGFGYVRVDLWEKFIEVCKLYHDYEEFF